MVKKISQKGSKKTSSEHILECKEIVSKFGEISLRVLENSRFYSFDELYKLIKLPSELENYLDKSIEMGSIEEKNKYYNTLQDMVKVYLMYEDIYNSTYNDESFKSNSTNQDLSETGTISSFLTSGSSIMSKNEVTSYTTSRWKANYEEISNEWRITK